MRCEAEIEPGTMRSTEAAALLGDLNHLAANGLGCVPGPPFGIRLRRDACPFGLIRRMGDEGLEPPTSCV